MKIRYKASIVPPAIAYLLVGIVYFFFLTHGTGEFFVREKKGGIYESLLDHFQESPGAVDPSNPLGEGRRVGNRTVVYYGPWPAFFRYPLTIVYPEFAEFWARLSCFLAAMLALLAIVLSVRNELKKSNVHRHAVWMSIMVLSIIGWGLGSPMLFLMSNASIWHEALLWGLCWSFWSLFFLGRLQQNHWNCLGFGVCTALALWSRLTFALPLFLIGATEIVRFLRGRYDVESISLVKRKQILFLVAPLILAALFQLAYNYSRFDSPLVFMANSRFDNPFSWNDPFKLGSVISTDRLASGMYNYMIPRAESFSTTFPFVKLSTVEYLNAKLYNGPYREASLALILVSPWLVVTSIIAVSQMRKAYQWLHVAALALQIVVVSSFGWITMRYLGDFLPLLLFAYLHCIGWACEMRALRAILIGVLIAISIFVSMASTAFWIAADSQVFISLNDRRAFIEAVNLIGVNLPPTK